jgi:hypothetical protein
VKAVRIALKNKAKRGKKMTKKIVYKCNQCGFAMEAVDLDSPEVLSSEKLYIMGMSFEDLHFCDLDCLTNFVRSIQQTHNNLLGKK